MDRAIEMAKYLADRIKEREGFELVVEVPMYHSCVLKMPTQFEIYCQLPGVPVFSGSTIPRLNWHGNECHYRIPVQ